MRKAKLAVHCIRKPFGNRWEKARVPAKFSIFGVSAIVARRQIWRFEFLQENRSTKVLVIRKRVKTPTSRKEIDKIASKCDSKKFFFQVSELDANEGPLIQNWSTLAG